MAERLNDVARAGLGVLASAGGWLLERLFWLRVAWQPRQQRRLRRALRLTDSEPIHPYDDKVKADLAAARERLGRRVLEAVTSGSTREPKRIVYTRGRLLQTEAVFNDVFLRYARAGRLRRKSVLVFSTLADDTSLTGMLVERKKVTPWLESLSAPHCLLRDPALKALVPRYGSDAVRLWVLALTNPGLLYATNPSTLATFLDAVVEDWPSVSALCAAYHAGRHPELERLFRRGASAGAARRMEDFSGRAAAPPMDVLVPALEGFSSWDGGYVRPFLEQVRRHLPPARYAFFPMYSMSTETIETVGGFHDGAPCFLPLAPGVLYEFLPAAAEDLPRHLLEATQLEPGQTYALVVSDHYGLRRYQTEDLFRCERRVRGLPDLRFVQRRNLSYSFTGEKLTGEHLREAYQRVLGEDGATFLTCVPFQPPTGLPRYKLVRVYREGTPPRVDPALAERVEAELREINHELDAKRRSQRLGPFELEVLSLRELVTKLGGAAQGQTWEAQFKFLPLYTKRWDELAA